MSLRGRRPAMDSLLAELSQGTYLYKIKSPTKLLQREFFLDTKNMLLFYKGSRKRNRNTDTPISNIREVREGEKDFSKKLKKIDKQMCLCLALKRGHKVMYLMASQKETRDKWLRGLRYAIQMENLAEQRNEVDRRIRDAFNMADKNGDNALDMEEIMRLLQKLNANIKRKYAQEMFDKADTNKTGRGRATLDREEFVKFYNALTRRPELEEIFLKYSKGKGYMVPKEILAFLRDGQKMADVDEDYCDGLIKNCEPEGACKSRGQLSLLGFQTYLMSERQQLRNPHHAVVYQDMTRPITHYFINSSHNTYLEDDQLRGASRVEMYISALRRGCRCVELDCWDGSDGEPVIYHGHTLTSKILFKDVISAVKEYAFKTSAYPVTLSIENHCSVEQQEVMARHLEKTLGKMIWSPDTELTAIPTPDQLKHKIIIKGKKLPLHNGISAREEDDDVSDEDESAEGSRNRAESRSSMRKKSRKSAIMNSNNNNIINNNIDNTSGADDKDEEASGGRKEEAGERSSVGASPGGHKKVKLSPALSRQTAMVSATFRDPAQAIRHEGHFVVFSLGESKVEKLMGTHALNLNAVTHGKLIRTYPAGTRTDSSNYNPVQMWNHGCQIVALNFQTGDEGMQLNHGRFLDNGGCGYVLKPNFLLAEEMFGMVNGIVSRNICKTLNITVISGQQIPKPKDSKKGEIIDPFVKIEVHGAPQDNSEIRTKTINNNGFNPRWYENFSFTVRVPELAIVRFVVKDDDRGYDDFIGYYALPFTSLQEVDSLLAELSQGTYLYRVKSPTKLLQREFFLDTKNMLLFYKGSRKRNGNTENFEKRLCYGLPFLGINVFPCRLSEVQLKERETTQATRILSEYFTDFHSQLSRF